MAVSGTCSEYTPFSVSEEILLSDVFHIIDCEEFVKTFPTSNITKFAKENKSNLPEEHKDIVKARKLFMVSVPHILPIVAGNSIREGSADEDRTDDEKVIEKEYEAYIYFAKHMELAEQAMMDPSFKCPLPECAVEMHIICKEIPLKILFYSRLVNNNLFNTIKTQIDKVKHSKVKESTSDAMSIPKSIQLSDRSSAESKTSSKDTQLVEKNERFLSFNAVLFARPVYNKNGELRSLLSGDLSDEATEIISSTAATAEQARLLGDNLEAFAEDISRERNYISRATKFPFLSHTTLTYLLQSHFHSGAMESNLDSLKKSFSVACLLPPQNVASDEYNGYVASSRNIEIDKILDQPAEKRSGIRKDVFIKGRQDNLDDFIAFCANIVALSRFLAKMDEKDDSSQPLIVQMILEIADVVSAAEYKKFEEKHKGEVLYMTHTLITYVFNIFSVFIKMAKNPTVVRKFKIDNTIDPKGVKIALMMHKSLLDQLQLCCATSSVQNLFAKPPSSFAIFCPTLSKQLKVVTSVQKNSTNPVGNNNETKGTKREAPTTRPDFTGSIVNKTGKKIYFPPGLDERYCSMLMDSEMTCPHGNDCNFKHTLFPSGFTNKGVVIMKNFVENTDGLSWNENAN